MTSLLKHFAFGGAALLCLTGAGLGLADDAPAAPPADTSAAANPAEGQAPATDEAAPAPAPAKPAAPKPPADVSAFLNRVFKALPKAAPTSYTFQAWDAEGKPTKEGFGLMPASGLNPEEVVARIMDVDHYVGNLDHVLVCRAIRDGRFLPPQSVRFYQKLDLSILGDIHHELVLVDGGTRSGYRLVYWYMLGPETEARGSDDAARSQYNVGAWIISDSAIGYALSSAPRREDVSFVKWAALTDGADIAAEGVVKSNIEGMITWVKRS